MPPLYHDPQPPAPAPPLTPWLPAFNPTAGCRCPPALCAATGARAPCTRTPHTCHLPPPGLVGIVLQHTPPYRTHQHSLVAYLPPAATTCLYFILTYTYTHYLNACAPAFRTTTCLGRGGFALPASTFYPSQSYYIPVALIYTNMWAVIYTLQPPPAHSIAGTHLH